MVSEKSHGYGLTIQCVRTVTLEPNFAIGDEVVTERLFRSVRIGSRGIKVSNAWCERRAGEVAVESPSRRRYMVRVITAGAPPCVFTAGELTKNRTEYFHRSTKAQIKAATNQNAQAVILMARV